MDRDPKGRDEPLGNVTYLKVEHGLRILAGRWPVEGSCDSIQQRYNAAPALNTPAAAQTGSTPPRSTPPCAGTSDRRTGVR